MASMYFVFAALISAMVMFLLKWLIHKMRKEIVKELTKYKKSNGLAEQAEWLEMKAVLRAFIEHCKFCYDETYSPDDAIESVLDHSKEMAWVYDLMWCLKKETYLGFSYPHMAAEAIMMDGLYPTLQGASKRALKACWSKYKAIKN